MLKESKMTTEDFGKAIPISPQAVRLWATGYVRPDIDKLAIICKLFNISADYLLGLREAKTPTEFVELNKRNAELVEQIKNLFV